jgi:hypothetical protein
MPPFPQDPKGPAASSRRLEVNETGMRPYF